MFTKNDLIDAIVDALGKTGQECEISPGIAGKPKAQRVFVTDRELRRMRAPGEKFIRLPEGAIISPLAKDWIDFERIKIIFDGKNKSV